MTNASEHTTCRDGEYSLEFPGSAIITSLHSGQPYPGSAPLYYVENRTTSTDSSTTRSSRTASRIPNLLSPEHSFPNNSYDLLGDVSSWQPALQKGLESVPQDLQTSELSQKRKRNSVSELATRENALVRDENPRKIIKRDSITGIVQGYQHTFGTNARIRSGPSPEQKRKTAITRAIGVCERCRQKKYRCDIPIDPLQPCERCQRAQHFLHKPCVRVEILDIHLHRLGSSTNNRLALWMAKQKRTQQRKLLLTQDMGKLPSPTMVFDENAWHKTSAVLEVTVAPFDAKEGDSTAYTWFDASGNARQLELPRYYIVDMEEAQRSMQEYAQRFAAAYVEAIPSSTNRIIRGTFSEACRFYSVTRSELVRTALDLWVANRITETYWRLCGDDTLGFAPIDDPESLWFDTIPVPPMMDTQLDEVAITGLLIPIKQAFLRRLKNKIEQRRKGDWYEIFIAVFVILSNAEIVLADVVDFSLRHAVLPPIPGRPSLSEGFVHAAKTVLVYFHFACNGASPLHIKLDGNHAGLSAEQIAFIESLRREVKRQASYLTGLKSGTMYRQDMYWCYQMLTREWDASLPPAGTLDPLTEEDLLLTW